MLTPTVSFCDFRFPQSFKEIADNDETKSSRAMMTTTTTTMMETNDDDDLALYADCWEDYSTEAFDIAVPDTDCCLAIPSPLKTPTAADQALLFDIESWSQSRAECSEELGSLLSDKETVNQLSKDEQKNDIETVKMETGGVIMTSHPPAYQLRISDACRRLNISNNPLLWTDGEVRSWCDWALSQYQVHPTRRKALLDDLHHNGISFSQLGERDFSRLFHSAGVYVFAELELWKNAAEISSTNLMTSSELMSINRTATGVLSTSSSNDCLWSTSQAVVNRVSTNLNSTDFMPTNSFSVNLTLTDPTAVSNTSTNVNSVNLAAANTHSIDSSSTKSTHSLTSWCTIPTFVLASVLNDDDDDSTEDSRRNQVPNRTSGDVMADGPRSNATSTSSLDLGYYGESDTSTGSSSSVQSESTTFQKEAIKGDLISSPDDWQPYWKQGHHLWQFLQELLQKPSVYEDCIRWIDRRQGIFKIEDSVGVARLWGERKNRPAMNYDKLSRSIRQYYKKGIIRKTNESKRLVYQFCPKYNI